MIWPHEHYQITEFHIVDYLGPNETMTSYKQNVLTVTPLSRRRIDTYSDVITMVNHGK